jgi:hypothetical protein
VLRKEEYERWKLNQNVEGGKAVGCWGQGRRSGEGGEALTGQTHFLEVVLGRCKFRLGPAEKG